MKLLLITSTYPTPRFPNQGVFNGQLAIALNQEHSVRVIAPIPWTSSRPWSRTPSQPSRQTDAIRVSHPIFYYPPRMLHWTYAFWYWISIRGSVRHMTSEFRPDVILGYWAHPDGAAALRAARSLGVPAVVMVGGSDVKILARSGRRRIAIQTVLQNADRVVAFSQDLARCVSELGVPLQRIEVVYRGVDRSIFQPRDRIEARRSLSIDCKVDGNSVIALWVGRLVEVKNPRMALQAAVKWKQCFGEKFRLVIIGDGHFRAGLEQYAETLGLKNCCSFLGSLPHEKIANWLQAANVTVLTSRSEGVPNVLLESIACGTPFVATDVGGVREIADLQVDKLVASGDVDGFQDAVVTLLSNRSEGSRPTSAYDVHALAKRMSGILEGL